MSFAPEPYRSACLEVVRWAILEARVLAWGNARLRNRLSAARQAQIADALDAVHNIPVLMSDWERCDPKRLRDFLVAYDRKWSRVSSVRLAQIYDDALRRASDEAGQRPAGPDEPGIPQA